MAKPVSIHPVNFTLIRHAIRNRGKKLQDVAEHIGVSPSQFSEMLSGLRKFSDERLILTADFLGVAANFFRTPTGRLAIQKADMDIIDWSLTPGTSGCKREQRVS